MPHEITLGGGMGEEWQWSKGEEEEERGMRRRGGEEEEGE